MIDQIIMDDFSLKKQFMKSQEAEAAIRKALEQSNGKPVVIIADPNCSGYASIKTASDHEPAHLLRYKPEFEAELMYLSSFQCGMALRSIRAKLENRFDLTSTTAM